MTAPILVTGGAGYIGSHVVLHLRDAGHEVVVYDNLSTGNAWAVLGAELIEGELSARDEVAALLSARRIKTVVHFAASIVAPESVDRPLEYYRNNTANTLGLLEACAAAGVERFVFSSTAAVYGVPQTTPVAEDAPLAPINPYGASKMMSERCLMDLAAATSMRYVILRYFNVAGADGEGRLGQVCRDATHLIKIACETVVGKRSGMQVYGTDYPTPDGTCIRDYIHVDDLARAHVDAVTYLSDSGASDILNCGYGHGASVLDVLAAVRRQSGTEIRVDHGARRPGDSPELVADNRKIRRVLNWAPRHDDLDYIVRTALEWERRLIEMDAT